MQTELVDDTRLDGVDEMVSKGLEEIAWLLAGYVWFEGGALFEHAFDGGFGEA